MAKFYFYYSAMNAGKSALLLQSNYNYHERGMKTLLFKPVIDTRSAINKITSRVGLESTAIPFDQFIDLYEYTKDKDEQEGPISCVLVDESHFLTKKQVYELASIVDKLNIPVLAYGLRTDFRGEPFEGSIYLLALADNMIEVKTVCHCGKKALMNMRIDEQGRKIKEGAQIFIGGNESYVSTCRKHFNLNQSGYHEIKHNLMEIKAEKEKNKALENE